MQSGRINCFVKIKGQTLKIGAIQPEAKVSLYDRSGVLQQTVYSDQNGAYNFKGCGKSEIYTIVAFDPLKQFNAVVQDNVVAK